MTIVKQEPGKVMAAVLAAIQRARNWRVRQSLWALTSARQKDLNEQIQLLDKAAELLRESIAWDDRCPCCKERNLDMEQSEPDERNYECLDCGATWWATSLGWEISNVKAPSGPRKAG